MVSNYKLEKGSSERLDIHFQPVLPPGAMVERIMANGMVVEKWKAVESEQGWVVLDFGFTLARLAFIEITWKGGITALPLTSNPQPGDRSVGFRILQTDIEGDSYKITLQGPRASRQEFRVWAFEPELLSAEGAEISGIDGNFITLMTDFADLETEYAVKTVVIQW
jgi:hypothetical protein